LLNRRDKRRYLAIISNSQPEIVVSALTKRNSELFGHVATQKASIKLIRTVGAVTIIRCSLSRIDDILASIALTDPAMVTLDVSGSIKRLAKRVEGFSVN
jgi:RNase P/RNase MRP subunit POP5